jgi:hypothetical protein
MLVSGLVTALNTVGGGLRALGAPLGRLSEDHLLRAAQRKTGLADFGDDGFRLPLRVLIQASDEPGRFNFTGRVMSDLRISRALINRLLVANEVTRHPDILEAPIRRPIFIASLPRTGTTLLHKLLAQDPHARALLAWEALLPARRAADIDKDPDPRIVRIQRLARVIRFLAPRLRALHDFDPEGPEECLMLLQNTFVLPLVGLPAYRAWYLQQPAAVIEAAYRDYRRQLQVLQWQRPREGHWLLKSPFHLYGIAALLTVFPDAAIVLIHRDPAEVIASTCSLLGFANDLLADDPQHRAALADRVVSWAAEGLRRAEAAREHAAPGRIYDIQYSELVADPLAAVRRLYAHFGYDYTPAFEARATAWLTSHPQNKYGKHSYSGAQFGLDRRVIDADFSWYRERYHIASE